MNHLSTEGENIIRNQGCLQMHMLLVLTLMSIPYMEW